MEFNYGKLLVLAAQEILPVLVPLIVATIVAYWPGDRPERKLLFVLSSAVISWGIPSLLDAIFSPFYFLMTHIVPVWEDEGYIGLTKVFVFISEALNYLIIGVAFSFIVIVPVFLRKQLWAKLVAT